jgi:hypothetical protein
MNIKHNLLYKTWAAGLRRRRNKVEEKLETKMFIRTQNLHMYILLTQTRTVTCYMTDPSSCLGESPTAHNRICLDYNQNLVMNPEGLNAKTDSD